MFQKIVFPVLMLLSIGLLSVRAQDTPITAVPVSYEGLKQEILKHRGKVVIVDFWSTRCAPCVASFPKFVEMQKKHGDKGLVVISVSLDDAKDEDDVKQANKLLTRWKSPLRNLIYDDKVEHLKKLDYEGLPFYYLFDRQGKWVRYRGLDFKDGVPYDDLENVAVRMLSEK